MIARDELEEFRTMCCVCSKGGRALNRVSVDLTLVERGMHRDHRNMGEGEELHEIDFGSDLSSLGHHELANVTRFFTGEWLAVAVLPHECVAPHFELTDGAVEQVVGAGYRGAARGEEAGQALGTIA